MQIPTVYQITENQQLARSIETLLDSSRFTVVWFQTVDEFVCHREQFRQKSECHGCVLYDACSIMATERLYSLAYESLYSMPIIAFTEPQGPSAKLLLDSGAFVALGPDELEYQLVKKLECALNFHHNNREMLERAARSQAASSKLSTRQADVVRKLLEGKGNKAIAFELGLSTRTIEIERALILQTFEVNNAIELARNVGQYQGIAMLASRFPNLNGDFQRPCKLL